ncbi:MAG: hypothetical protein ACR2G9_00930 [Gaiellaceae bacterium]
MLQAGAELPLCRGLDRGKKSQLSCLFARTQPTETEQEALTEIKKSTRLVKQLRRVHVGQRLAASVVVKGIASACS